MYRPLSAFMSTGDILTAEVCLQRNETCLLDEARMRVIAASPSAEVTMYSKDVDYLATGLSTQLQDCDTLTAEVRPCSFFIAQTISFVLLTCIVISSAVRQMS